MNLTLFLTLKSALIMAEEIPRAPDSFEECRRLTRRFEAPLILPLGVILARGGGAISGFHHDYESKKKTKNLMVNFGRLTLSNPDLLFPFLILLWGRKNG